MGWTPLKFGKYAGKTLPQVLFSDPDWFFWAYEEDVFARYPSVGREAEEIYRRARSIRVPDEDGEPRVAEYTIDPTVHRFGGLELVPASWAPHEGASSCCRRGVIDMMEPRDLAEYDKRGMKMLLSDMKEYLFGDSAFRMTKQRCEEFFDDDDNFVL